MKRIVFVGLGILAIAAIIFVLIFCFRIVPNGNTAIVTTFGRLEDYTLSPGAHFKSPSQSIILMNNREQPVIYQGLAFSSDTQEVAFQATLNFALDASSALEVYKKVGPNYINITIMPRLKENIKGVFAKFSASELIKERSNLSELIKQEMVADLSPYGITVISMAIEDVDFSDAYTNAVEGKQVEEQLKLRSVIEQERITNETRQQAERRLIDSKAALAEANNIADAQAYAITKKAEAESEANLKLSQSITPELTQYLEVQRWNGVRVMTIEGATPLITMPAQ